MAAAYVFFIVLGFMSSECYSQCTIPQTCSYCSFWDHHHNKELYQVVCQDAHLTTIPKNLTYFLGNFLASYNNITNITKSSFPRYSYLKILTLNHNHLEDIEDGSFLTQALLEKLFLNFNRIRQIGAGTFKGLMHLQRLSLRRNFIFHLPKNVFSDLHSLKILELGDNRISTIDKEAYDGLTNLESLYLGGNFLKTITIDTFGSLASLTMLDLSFNLIEEISENGFQGLSNLEVLHINDCRLKKLPKKEPFKGLNRLKELDLSTNPLLFLSFNTFVNFLKLEILNLSSTNISVMHHGTFQSFKSLKRLYVNDNPFVCDCNLKWMSEWIQKHVNNSNVILEMKTTTRCALPHKLAGKRIDTLTPDSFSCSCDTCKKSASCLSKGGADACKCDSNWMGHSCDLVCNATQKHECSSLNGTCYCSHFLPQQSNYSVTCPQNAMLLNVSNVWTCKCSDGFTGNGTFCTNITKEQEKEGSHKTNVTSHFSFAITLSLAISGSVIAVAILVLVVWCTWRQRKSSNNRCSEVVPQGVVLDVLPGLQENHVYLNHALKDTPIQDEWEIPKNKLVVGEVIGEGEFGVVREGTLMTEKTAVQVAIKSLREHCDHTDAKDFLRELDMFKGIGKHPNVVSLIGACTSDGPLLIITEYVSGGTLLDLLRNSRRSNTVYVNTEVVSALEQNVRLKLALDVAKGMAHVSNHRFVHRDLAARNVLVTDDMTAKITDFGLARDIYSDGIYLNSKGGRLPLKWMSPESLQDYIYTTQSDVWSFGILIWEIWSLGTMPYSTVLPHELLSKLTSGYRLERPPDCPNEVYDVILSCWNEEPMLRPTFCDLCMIFEEIASAYEPVTNSNKNKQRSNAEMQTETNKTVVADED